MLMTVVIVAADSDSFTVTICYNNVSVWYCRQILLDVYCTGCPISC